MIAGTETRPVEVIAVKFEPSYRNGIARYFKEITKDNKTIRIDVTLKTRDKRIAMWRYGEIDQLVAAGVIDHGLIEEQLRKQGKTWFSVPRDREVERDRFRFRILWQKVLAYWKKIHPDTFEHYYDTISKALLDYFGEKDARSLRKSHATDYQMKRFGAPKKRGGKVKGSTVNRELQVAQAGFNLLKEWGDLDFTENPFAIKRLREFQKERYLEKEELSRLLVHCPLWLKPLVVVAVLTGLRVSELLAMQFRHVNFGANRIGLDPELVKNKKYQPISMSTALRTVVWGLSTGKGPQDYVFPCEDGRCSSYSRVRNAFMTAVKAAELEDVTLHTLRHTFLTQLSNAGEGPTRINKLGRHGNMNTTMRYVHVGEGPMMEAMERLGTFLGEAVKLDGYSTVPEREAAEKKA